MTKIRAICFPDTDTGKGRCISIGAELDGWTVVTIHQERHNEEENEVSWFYVYARKQPEDLHEAVRLLSKWNPRYVESVAFEEV